eukprot:424347_1
MSATLIVKTVTGKEIQLNVALTATVLDVQLALAVEEHIHNSKQVLIFENKTLSHEMKLNYYGIKNNSILYLLREQWEIDWKKQCIKAHNALKQTNDQR